MKEEQALLDKEEHALLEKEKQALLDNGGRNRPYLTIDEQFLIDNCGTGLT